jgi:hypothetical protein
MKSDIISRNVSTNTAHRYRLDAEPIASSSRCTVEVCVFKAIIVAVEN